MPQLKFSMQAQVLTNWCWAATSASASYFYDNGTTWAQCKIACSCLTRNDCCGPDPNQCNEPWYLERALTITGNFLPPLVGDALGINDIIREVDTGKIIGARVKWSNGGGHFVAIYGYDNTLPDPYIYVADPIYGTSFININNFTNNYQGSGQWTHSYYTQSVPGAMIQLAIISDQIIQKSGRMKAKMGHLAEKLENISQHKPIPLIYPHDTYLIDYQSISNGSPEFHKTGFRVSDPDTENNQLIYDFSDSGPEASLHQVINDTKYIKPYLKSLKKVLRDQLAAKETYALRLVKQPELKLEALWLHSLDKPANDKFIPLIAPAGFVRDTVYSLNSFFSILITALKDKKPNEDNLLGG